MLLCGGTKTHECSHPSQTNITTTQYSLCVFSLALCSRDSTFHSFIFGADTKCEAQCSDPLQVKVPKPQGENTPLQVNCTQNLKVCKYYQQNILKVSKVKILIMQ